MNGRGIKHLLNGLFGSTMKSAVFGIAAILIATNTFGDEKGQEKSSESQASETRAVKDDNEIICKRMTRAGTHFKKRVCMKRRNWRIQSDNVQSQTEGGYSQPAGPRD